MPPARGKEEVVRNIKGLRRDERGATAVEYGLILALVFLAMIGSASAFGQQAIILWTGVAGDVSTAAQN